MRKFIKKALLFFLLPSVLFAAVPEEQALPSIEDDGRSVFTKMQQAASSKNYELQFVRVSAGTVEPISFSHGVVSNGEISHWLYLNGDPSGYFTRDDLIIYFSFGQEPFAVKNGRLPSVFARLMKVSPERVFESYTPVYVGVKRIAGREAKQVRLIPKNHDKYSYLLSSDSKSGILLQVDVINKNDSIIISYAAVNLSITTTPNAIVENVENASVAFPSGIQNTNSNIEFKWKVNWLPNGTTKVFAQKYAIGKPEINVEHVIYSDGVVDFSVYRIPAVGSMDFPVVRQGSTNLFRNMISPYEIIVVGELPLETERQIAESYQGE